MNEPLTLQKRINRYYLWPYYLKLMEVHKVTDPKHNQNFYSSTVK